MESPSSVKLMGKCLPSEQMCIHVKIMTFKMFGICIYDAMLSREK